jgi:hypothetical protein
MNSGGAAACSCPEVTRHELIADLRRSRTYALETKVAHLGNSLVGRPRRLSSPRGKSPPHSAAQDFAYFGDLPFQSVVRGGAPSLGKRR